MSGVEEDCAPEFLPGGRGRKACESDYLEDWVYLEDRYLIVPEQQEMIRLPVERNQLAEPVLPGASKIIGILNLRILVLIGEFEENQTPVTRCDKNEIWLGLVETNSSETVEARSKHGYRVQGGGIGIVDLYNFDPLHVMREQ